MFASRRVLALLTLTGVAMTACTEQAEVTPSTATIEAAPTTIEPEPEPSTTTAPDTTLAPETTVAETTSTVPETTVAPTTTAPATGDPTTVSTEYFVGGAADAWLYLGRWTGNAWERDLVDDELVQPLSADGTDVALHSLDADPVDATLDGTGEACAADARTGPIIVPGADAPADPGFGFGAIAFSSDWPTEPRPVAVVDASIDSYVAAGVAAFGGLDVDASNGAIQQLVVADLDGDGDTEALVAFGGDGFSALLLIDADTGASITIARSVETTTTAAAPDPDADPEADVVVPVTEPADTYRMLAVTDLNGDGRAEIIVHTFVGDRAAVTAITYDGTEVESVLATRC